MSVYLTAILIGLVHGLEPGHGWPVAVLYSLRRRHRLWWGLVTSSILAGSHLLSSLAVVAVFLLLSRVVDLASFPAVRYTVVAVLLFLAYRAYREPHGHAHPHPHPTADSAPGPSHVAPAPRSLWDLAVFAFLLGFIHEEEFALLALCLGGVRCVTLMLAYALAVSAALIAVTALAIQGYHLLEHRLRAYEGHLPKGLAALLVLMAALYLLRIL